MPALRFSTPPLPWIVGALVAAVIGVVLARRAGGPGAFHPAEAAVLASLVCTGTALGGSARETVRSDCRTWLPDGTPVVVRGVLAANGAPLQDTLRTSPPALPVHPQTVRAGGAVLPGCDGEMRVRLPRSAAPLLAGTEIEIRGQWRRAPRPPRISNWPRTPRFAGTLRADSLTVVEEPRFGEHPLLTLRGRTERRLHRLFPRQAAMADALLLGRREGLDPAMRERFVRAGLAHLLAISGMHVALLAGALYLVGQMFGIRRPLLSLLTILAVAGYLAMIGAPTSAVRAGIMVSLALLGALLQRPSAALPIVAFAAAVLLVRDPLSLLDPGFQLSFAGVLGIIAFRGVLLRQVPTRWRHGVPKYLVEAAAVSIAAFAATAPITAHHFGQVAPVSILANLPAIPVMSVALVGVAAAALVEPVVPPLGSLLADGASGMLDLLEMIAQFASTLPYAYAQVAPPQWPLWAAAGVVLLLGLDAAGRMRPRIQWAAAVGSTAAFVLLWPVFAVSGAPGLELHFLDVGQGDAIAIRTPADRWILVDAGPRDDQYDAGLRRVLPFLRAHGVQRLEALVLTHPHADHIGGAAAVLGAMPVGQLIEPGLVVGSPTYLETLRAAEQNQVPYAVARSGRTLALDGVALDLLWPDEPLLDGVQDANEISAVMRVRYGNFSALLTGDATDAVEQALTDRYGTALRSQVLKAGHHGSRTSTSSALLDAVRPELVVVSAGRRNFYGHPAPEVLDRLAERGIRVARTDREGTVSVRVDETGWRRVGQ